MNKKDYFILRSKFDFKIKEFKMVKHLLFDFIFLFIPAGCLLNQSSLCLKFFSIPLISVLMFRSFALMHDASHGAVSSNKQVNFLIGIISASICMLAFEPWKNSHKEHHFWSGNVEKDPVMGFVRLFPNMPSSLKLSLGFVWKSWLPFIGLVQQIVFWSLAFKQLLVGKRTFNMVSSIVLPVLLWSLVGYVIGLDNVLMILLPAVALYLLMVEVVNFPHHLGMKVVEGDIHYPVWEQAATVRTCLYPKIFTKFIALNFNYHIEHHMFPDVPWYYLEELHLQVSKVIPQDEYTVDPYMKWIIENKKISLSDVLSTSRADQVDRTKKAA